MGLFEQDPPPGVGGLSNTPPISHEHYRQNFIGFKIWVDTETLSSQEPALLDKQEINEFCISLSSFTAG